MSTEPQALAKLNATIEAHDLTGFSGALKEMIATPYRKRWPEQVLGNILCEYGMPEDIKTEMVKQLLECKRKPRPRYSVGNPGDTFLGAMELAMEVKAYNSMLLLYRAGFEFPDDQLLHLASAVGKGEWPHPEIFAPNIMTLDVKNVHLLFANIFNSEGVSEYTIERLKRLESNEETPKRFARFLARISRPMYEKDYESLLASETRLKAVQRLADIGLLDIEEMKREEAGRDLWRAIQARLEEIQLNQDTPVVGMRSGRGLRL